LVPGQIDVPDQIDLADIAYGTVTSKKGPLSYNGNLLGGTLTVTDGVHTANIALLGQYMASEFALSNDGHGGTLITFEASSSTTTVTGGAERVTTRCEGIDAQASQHLATAANSPRAGSTRSIELSYAQSLTRGFRCPLCDRRFIDNIARHRHLLDSTTCDAVKAIPRLQFLLADRDEAVAMARRQRPRRARPCAARGG
jgi:hypothetical protein